MKPQVASSRPGRRAIVRKRLSSSYALLYQRSSIRRRCSFSSPRRAFGSRPRSLAMRASYDRAAAVVLGRPRSDQDAHLLDEVPLVLLDARDSVRQRTRFARWAPGPRRATRLTDAADVAFQGLLQSGSTDR